MSSTQAQTLASRKRANVNPTTTGTVTFRLTNSWTYDAGTYPSDADLHAEHTVRTRRCGSRQRRWRSARRWHLDPPQRRCRSKRPRSASRCRHSRWNDTQSVTLTNVGNQPVRVRASLPTGISPATARHSLRSRDLRGHSPRAAGSARARSSSSRAAVRRRCGSH